MNTIREAEEELDIIRRRIRILSYVSTSVGMILLIMCWMSVHSEEKQGAALIGFLSVLFETLSLLTIFRLRKDWNNWTAYRKTLDEKTER